MKLLIAILLWTLIACAQKTDTALPKLKRSPSLVVAPVQNSTAVIDTDMFDAQKYVEQTGGDSSGEKTKRTSHEAALTRELMAGFNQAKECDGIVFSGKGENKPGFRVQVMVDSHDTPGQKPVWVWILGDAARNKFISKGEEDSNSIAATNICLAVWKAAADAEVKTAGR